MHEKKFEKSHNNNIFKLLAPTWNEIIDLPDDQILHEVFKIILSISLRSMKC